MEKGLRETSSRPGNSVCRGNKIMKHFKPYTPSRRSITVEDFSNLTKKAPEKSLMRPMLKKGGRNNWGLLVVRHQGGGHKRAYRMIDFRRNKPGVPGTVAALEY